MREEACRFFSDGLRLRGKFFLPVDDGPPDGEPRSLLVPCSGFTGLVDFHPARFARALTPHGIVCFGFDYRGFGDSEGSPGRVILEEQVRDVQHAVAYAAADPRIDPSRIFLLGWGMGAGLVLDAGRHLPGVRGLICLNGFYSGRRLYEANRTPGEMEQLYQDIRLERRHRATTGETRWVDPFSFYMLDSTSRGYVDAVLRGAPGYNGGKYSFELADSLLTWEPDAYAPNYRVPLLIGHSTENTLHSVEEAWRLFVTYGGPRELYWLDGVGHTEWMLDDNATFQVLAVKLAAWVRERNREPPVLGYTLARQQSSRSAVSRTSEHWEAR